ncbi:MAG TPA: universal stress protein [Gemmataceae bacterium]|jgi:nucleotide-binding universal stress UspA family protein
MIRIKKILYPTDFSSYSNQAYFHAISLAEKHNASLTVLFVYNPDTTTTPGSQGDEVADRRYWQGQLEQIRPVDTSIPVTHVLLQGDPASEIVRYGRDAGIDMVVMGTHGRTGVERLLMGSVAEKVLRDAPCSVMVVKLPRGQPVTSPGEVAVAATK